MDDPQLNPLVDVSMGITIPGPQDYSSIRCDVRFSNINVAFDIEPQIEKCAEVARQVAEGVEKQLAEQVSNASGLNIEGLGLGKAFGDFKTRMTAWAKEINKLTGFIPSSTADTSTDSVGGQNSDRLSESAKLATKTTKGKK